MAAHILKDQTEFPSRIRAAIDSESLRSVLLFVGSYHVRIEEDLFCLLRMNPMLPKMVDVVLIPNKKEPPFPLKSRHATTVTHVATL